MKFFAPLSLTLASCVALISHSSEALACGGCFHGVNEATPSVVTAHRMALSISPSRTVLWDQVEYAGDPKEFAWVLPVGDGAFVEEADDAFFEALEAVTATRVMSRVITCNGQQIQQQEAAGCGATPPVDTIEPRSTDSTTEQQGAVRGVTVVHEGTIGPYETATIKSADPQALRTWLTTNGYAIPSDIDPVIDAYVAQGTSFIALRLQPGVGVRQMTPVRVITPGASPILPLRMVAAGTGASVSIVLYVIGEGRYRAAMRPQAFIGPDDLTWNWSILDSDYSEVRAKRLQDGSFLTSFSQAEGLTAQVITTDGTGAQYQVFSPADNATLTENNLTDLYFAQAGANDSLAIKCGQVHSALSSADPTARVAEPCDPMDPSCVFPADAIDSSTLECDGHRDIATALVGMHPRDVWVTRLEADLPREALADDLIIEADVAQSPISNWMIAGNDANLPPCNPPMATTTPNETIAPQSGCACTARPSRSFDPLALMIAAMALLHGAKQYRKR